MKKNVFYLKLLFLSMFPILSFAEKLHFTENKIGMLTTTATLEKNCSVSAENVSFGVIDSLTYQNQNLSVPVGNGGWESNLRIKVKCNKNTSYEVKGEHYKQVSNGGYAHVMLGQQHGEELHYGIWFKEGADKGVWFAEGSNIPYFNKSIKSIGNANEQEFNLAVIAYSHYLAFKNLQAADFYSSTYRLTLEY